MLGNQKRMTITVRILPIQTTRSGAIPKSCKYSLSNNRLKVTPPAGTLTLASNCLRNGLCDSGFMYLLTRTSDMPRCLKFS